MLPDKPQHHPVWSTPSDEPWSRKTLLVRLAHFDFGHRRENELSGNPGKVLSDYCSDPGKRFSANGGTADHRLIVVNLRQMAWFTYRRWQRLGFFSGLGVLGGVWLLLEWITIAQFIAPGPMNTGHDDVACADCHLEERGSTRQQIQATIAHWRGQRDDVIYVGTRPAGSNSCIECHERPDDRHPIYRFREPRFEEAREELGANLCTSCHAEHSGVRVTQEQGFCRSCHEDLQLKNDPLDVSHVELVEQDNWFSCMTCHDFHGNHAYEVPTRMVDAFSESSVRAYLRGEQTLYSEEKKHGARKSGE